MSLCRLWLIISSIDGLWDRKILKHGENCILVPPGDTAALRDAIELLDKDDMLRNDLGRAARETAVNHFGLERMDNALLSMVEDLRSVYPKENRAA